MIQNTRKGGRPVSHDDALTAGGVCSGDERLSTASEAVISQPAVFGNKASEFWSDGGFDHKFSR